MSTIFTITASTSKLYVIVRGATLGASQHGMFIGNHSNIIIENCDISNWGRGDKQAWRTLTLEFKLPLARHQTFDYSTKPFIICYSSNTGHKNPLKTTTPDGPQGISWDNNKGNHVIRYNEIFSDEEHLASTMPRTEKLYHSVSSPNCDIYGNIINHCWDDGLELEGGGENLRVWNNYVDNTMMGIPVRCYRWSSIHWRNVYSKADLHHTRAAIQMRQFFTKRTIQTRQSWLLRAGW